MKNLFKTIRTFIVTAVAALFVAVPLVQASSPVFNDLSQDNEFMVGRKAGTGSYTDPVNNINGGDEVEVAVYYHNARPDTIARNVKIKINLPDTAVARNQHVLTGAISADNAETVTGTIVNGQEIGQPGLTINTLSNTKISFVPGSVKWFPNRMDPAGNGVNLPNSQTGDSIITSGINLGDIEGCFQFAGYVIFKVRFQGEVVKTPVLTVKKEVRKAGTQDPFIEEIKANPGHEVEYRIKVQNLDGQATAKNIRVKDFLPQGLTFKADSATLYKHNSNDGMALPANIFQDGGAVILDELKPLESFTIYFTAATDTSLKDEECRVNEVVVSAENAQPAKDSANVCFLVKVTPTPTPTPAPVPTPQPELPKTGGETGLLATLGIGAVGASVSRYYLLKEQLKKKLRNLDIV